MKRHAVAMLLLLGGLGCGKTALKFSPDALPEAKVGQPYRVEIGVAANSTPVGGMSVDAPPPGLELHFTRDDKHAVLEGTPTKAGEYAFKVSAWCYGTNVSGQTGARDYRIVVR